MNIKISLSGDVLISRRIPKEVPQGLKEIKGVLDIYECNFANLETCVLKDEGYPEAYPGGTYTIADPLCLKDLKNLGFNIFNTANNHAMDFSHEGLLATIKYLDLNDIPHAGTGRNLSEASSPTFFECKNGRIAMLGVTSSFHDSYLAGPQNQEIKGRPGVAPLRHKAIYELDEKNYNDLVRIASVSGINAYHDQARKEGFLPNESLFKFGTFNFELGKENKVHTYPLEVDLNRTLENIKNARMQSDIVIVSIHSHQFKGLDKHNTPDFIRTFAQKCIDGGADIIVCHGPHLMRGIEIYKNRLIFHGLGNFILQLDTRKVVGEEEYMMADTTRFKCSGFGELNDLRTKGGKIGLNADSSVWYSFFAGVDFSEDSIYITLYPIEISQGYNGGLPCLSKNVEILKELQKLSDIYGTSIKIDKDKVCGYICIQK